MPLHENPIHNPVSLGRGGGTGPNPTDRGKGEVKRSLLTEAGGIPVGLAVEGPTATI